MNNFKRNFARRLFRRPIAPPYYVEDCRILHPNPDQNWNTVRLSEKRSELKIVKRLIWAKSKIESAQISIFTISILDLFYSTSIIFIYELCCLVLAPTAYTNKFRLCEYMNWFTYSPSADEFAFILIAG